MFNRFKRGRRDVEKSNLDGNRVVVPPMSGFSEFTSPYEPVHNGGGDNGGSGGFWSKVIGKKQKDEDKTDSN